MHFLCLSATILSDFANIAHVFLVFKLLVSINDCNRNLILEQGDCSFSVLSIESKWAKFFRLVVNWIF